MQKIDRFKFYSTLVLIASFASYILFIVAFDYFYQSVFYRGLLETNVWLARVDSGDFAREYYHIIHFMMNNLNLSLVLSVNILSTICVIYALSKFRWLTNLKSAVYFFLAFNLFSLLLVYSPGRTSLTVLALLFCYSGFYPRVNYLSLILGISILGLLHPETILIAIMFVSYSKVISVIDCLIKNKLFNIFVKLNVYLVIMFILYILLGSGNEYTEITSGAGNLLNIFFILAIVFSVFIFSGIENFVLLFMLFFGLIIVMGMNASYVYRVVIFPIVLGVYFRQQYVEER
ncbi:hypothetical protein [Aeromonas enteropelogenes]|uniref:hypothetical protein n=1 Tax=Aeromonas enteropelogenes TaxID=29489 RepID=UPI003BA14AFA